MKILVTGASGQLGHDVCIELDRRGIENLGVDSDDFDITDKNSVVRCFESFSPDAVIHCAAYTAVDKAEDDADLCRAVNVLGSKNIAECCRSSGAKMMYISTDYVFPGDGDNYYETDDPVMPASIYGITKLAGEEAVKAVLNRYFIVRTSWVFGLNGGNFVKTMLRLSNEKNELSVVCDQIGSPTFTEDLSNLLCDMIITDKYGIYHATNEGICSWAEFAETIFKFSGKNVTVKSISTEEYNAKAPRPKNSRLCKKKLEENGFKRLPSWQDALARYIRKL